MIDMETIISLLSNADKDESQLVGVIENVQEIVWGGADR